MSRSGACTFRRKRAIEKQLAGFRFDSGMQLFVRRKVTAAPERATKSTLSRVEFGVLQHPEIDQFLEKLDIDLGQPLIV